MHTYIRRIYIIQFLFLVNYFGIHPQLFSVMSFFERDKTLVYHIRMILGRSSRLEKYA